MQVTTPFLTCLPRACRSALEGLRSEFKWNHFLTFSWLLVLQLLNYGPGNRFELSRMTRAISYFQLTRFLRARYGDPNRWRFWLGTRIIEQLPHPESRIFEVVIDTTHKPKRSKRNPAMARGKNRDKGPWLFGLHILLICGRWHTYRIPLLFAVIRAKNAAGYQSPNQALTELLQQIPVPAWAQQVIVLADAGFASKANFKRFRKWGWDYVVRLPRTWKLTDGRHLKQVIEQTKSYRKIWLPSSNGKHRKTYFVHWLPASLHQLGHVHLILSKWRRNFGPDKVHVLVTHLPLSAKAVLALYQGRWSVEVLFKEIKGTVALGQHQVNSDFHQIEKSVGISLAAYLLLLRLQANHIPKKGSWSAFELKRRFWQETMNQVFSHSVDLEVRKRGKFKLSAQAA